MRYSGMTPRTSSADWHLGIAIGGAKAALLLQAVAKGSQAQGANPDLVENGTQREENENEKGEKKKREKSDFGDGADDADLHASIISRNDNLDQKQPWRPAVVALPPRTAAAAVGIDQRPRAAAARAVQANRRTNRPIDRIDLTKDSSRKPAKLSSDRCCASARR